MIIYLFIYLFLLFIIYLSLFIIGFFFFLFVLKIAHNRKLDSIPLRMFGNDPPLILVNNK